MDKVEHASNPVVESAPAPGTGAQVAGAQAAGAQTGGAPAGEAQVSDVQIYDPSIYNPLLQDPPINLTPRIVQVVVCGLALLACCVAYRYLHPSSTFAADGDVRWNAAVERSHQANTPALVLFTADWCPACRALHANVLSREDVQAEIASHYTMLTIDLTEQSPAAAARASKFGVSAIPTLIRFDAQGKEVSRTHGLPPEKMLAWLRDGE